MQYVATEGQLSIVFNTDYIPTIWSFTAREEKVNLDFGERERVGT
jgi:hypothetical protein